MSVDFFWRRVGAATVPDSEAGDLWARMPHWFDADFTTESAAGRMVGVEDTADLIHAVLTMGAAEGPYASAAGLPVYGADGLDDQMIGVLTPAQVSVAAEFLAQAPVEQWVADHREHLDALAGTLGYHRPFTDEWANEVAKDARSLVTLFEHAAADGEAIIVAVSA